MKSPTRFDANIDTIGVGRNLVAVRVPMKADPPIPVDGLTIGIAEMSENSPHDGEMHPDDGLVVPQGVWHRVDILSPSKIMYATPGPGGEYRPL